MGKAVVPTDVELAGSIALLAVVWLCLGYWSLQHYNVRRAVGRALPPLQSHLHSHQQKSQLEFHSQPQQQLHQQQQPQPHPQPHPQPQPQPPEQPKRQEHPQPQTQADDASRTAVAPITLMLRYPRALAVFLPFYTLSALSTRVRERFLFGILGNFLIVSTLITTTVVIIIASPEAASALCGCTLVILGFVLFLFAKFAGKDATWCNINGFVEHRKVRLTFTNGVACVSLGLSMLQMVALATKLLIVPDPNSSSWYDQAKASLINVMGIVLFDFHLGGQQFLAYIPPTVSCIGVFCWWVLYGGDALNAITLADKRLRMSQCNSSQLHKMQEGTRTFYSTLAARPYFTTAFLLLSDSMSVGIVAGLLGVLVCSPGDEQTWRLERYPDFECFQGGHRFAAVVVVWAIVYYVFASALIAPFMTAESNGAFDSDQLDVRYEPRFLLHERMCRFAITVVSIYWSNYVSFCRAVYIALASWLAFISSSLQPSSVPWINVVLSGTYIASVVVGVCVFLDGIGVEGWPFIGMLVGVNLVLLVVVWRVRRMTFVTHEFVFSEEVGRRYRGTVLFSDVNLLRGEVHRLRALTFYSSGIFWRGVEAIYEVDGVSISSPFNVFGELPRRTSCWVLRLSDGECIVAMHPENPSDVSLQSMALATNHGRREFLFDRFFKVPDDVSDWYFKVPPGHEVVGVHGGGRTCIDHFGLILEKRSDDFRNCHVCLQDAFPMKPFSVQHGIDKE